MHVTSCTSRITKPDSTASRMISQLFHCNIYHSSSYYCRCLLMYVALVPVQRIIRHVTTTEQRYFSVLKNMYVTSDAAVQSTITRYG